MVSMASFAQEEDVTNYIANAGFDEDLTFQADGKMKDAVSTDQSLSGRSWAYIAADSTVYARPKDTSSQTRPDGRKMDAVNGFKGRVKGWTLESNATFPQCEWTYFGSVAYDLAENAVPIADDGTTYLTVPARPTEEFDGGAGFVYLRAGWTNSAIYKQVVKLPCAKYRLEYWTININPNTTAVAEDLTQIVCRKDVFKDEEGTGLNAQVWTKHEFEFTPTAEFTMQFGYKAANAGSGGQPIVGLDGIKLYKIDDADRDEINMSDLFDMADECTALAGEATSLGAVALAGYIGDYGMDLEDIDATGDELEAAVKAADARMTQIREAIAQIEKIQAILAKMDNLMKEKNFPGKDAFQAAYEKILGYIEGQPAEDEDVVAEILGAVEEGNAAIKAYYMSQMDTASEANPADFTVFVEQRWFINPNMEPTVEDGLATYNEGDLITDNIQSDKWYVAGTTTGGDQNAKIVQSRTAWNAWATSIDRVAVAQDLTDLPNGYYTVTADLITQADYANQTQVVFAQSSSDKTVSPALEVGTWEGDNATGTGAWTTLTTKKVLVVDGKLTIGAEGYGNGATDQSGWFCATNFQLSFLGLASDDVINEAVKKALNDKVAEANDFVATMHFKADQKALNDTVAKYKDAEGKDDIIAATGIIDAALTEAKASEAKYLDYLPEDETIIEGKTLREIPIRLAETDLATYPSFGAAKEIVQFAYNYVTGWMACDTASYKEFDAKVNLLKNYANTYAPAYMEAAELAKKASDAGKTALEAVMNEQKAQLMAEMKDAETVNAYVAALKTVMYEVNKQIAWDTDKDASDYTAFIQNPNAEAVDGWTFVMGNGDGNGEKGGQWYSDEATRYFDTYNSGGLKGFMASQVVTGLPNGTYKVSVDARTPAEGAYVFAGTAADTTFVEIPLNYHNPLNDATGEYAGKDTMMVASDKWGPIWENAKTIMESAEYNSLPEDEQTRIDAIYNANNGEGRGWKHMTDFATVTVTNHELFIGTMTGTEDSKTEKVFAGNWYSVGAWKLTLTEKGDNGDWAGPITGIETVSNNVKVDGIYTLTGVKADKMQRGLNIVVRNGKVQKVLVK